MRTDCLEIDTALTRRWEPRLLLQDVEAIRLLLSGGSPIDWQRLAFRGLTDVDRFLALHLIDVDDADDRTRLRYVYNEAVSYLEENLGLTFPAEIRSPEDVRQPFLWASQWDGFRRTQILSCVILKLMHVIQHMEAADLRHKAAISEEACFDLAYRRVLDGLGELREAGLPIVSVHASRKARSSVISKLIAKRDNVAATIFDKIRFRIVTQQPGDIVPTLAWLTQHLFPFNYVIPGQSYNNLVRPEDVIAQLPREERTQVIPEPPILAQHGKNEFSGSSYRMLNFIVDLPVALPDDVRPAGFSFELGKVVYVLIEFQVLDEATAEANERGDSAHHAYKARQDRVVAARLKRGGLAR
jgi:uncharacterized protein (TIGR04552 family)